MVRKSGTDSAAPSCVQEEVIIKINLLLIQQLITFKVQGNRKTQESLVITISVKMEGDVMKRVIAVMSVVLCVMTITGTTEAQLNVLDIDVNLSYPMPTGDFADAYKAGFGAGADVFVGLPILPTLKLGGRVAYNRFGVEDIFDGGDMSIIEILPSVRFEISPPLSPVGAFAQFGVGMYNWSSKIEMPLISGLPKIEDDGTDFGICVGAGVKLKIPGSVGLMAMPLYHIIFTEDENTTYLSLNVGVIF